MVKACFPKMEGVELVSLNDIPDVDDSSLVEGADYEENAKMKAVFYFKKTGIPTISTDNIFWLEKWKKDNGVLVHMRKEANPKSPRATDEEVLVWLKKWVKSVGGKSAAHFNYAVAFANENGVQSFTSVQREYILQTKQSKEFWPGFVLHCGSVFAIAYDDHNAVVVVADVDPHNADGLQVVGAPLLLGVEVDVAV
jgi:inosine/xanthosine triphosphate pyrophosphatase family protein